MVESILAILATLLPALVRWFEGREKRRAENDIARFRKALANGDTRTVNDLLFGVPTGPDLPRVEGQAG